jgi:hypothetical protein
MLGVRGAEPPGKVLENKRPKFPIFVQKTVVGGVDKHLFNCLGTIPLYLMLLQCEKVNGIDMIIAD